MTPELSFLTDTVREAGKLLFGDGSSHVSEKGYADFVTEADMAVQRFVTDRIRESYPDAGILSEESPERPDTTQPLFILDPVDGTTNLIHGLNTSCIALGYAEGGRPVMGAVYNPFTGELYEARRGCGARLNGAPIAVSKTATLRDSLVLVGTSPYRKDNAAANMDMIRRVFSLSLDFRRSGSSALDLCSVAAGRTDAFAEADLKPWDFCAASVILEEAGGIITDWQGREPDWFNNLDLLASNRKVHGKMLEITFGIPLRH